jgi:AmmeMemoRadiSam system protein B
MNDQPKIKAPAVAGYFYPADRKRLERNMINALEHEKGLIDRHVANQVIIGGVVPHAGINYCSRQAVHFFELVRRSGQHFDTVLIVHPNHYGYGPEISVDGYDYWETPMGMAAVDTGFMHALELPVSPSAQHQEHSAEVVVPWLQYFLPESFSIVAVNIRKQDPAHACLLADRIARANKQLKRKLLFVASSDFSHYLSPSTVSGLDNLVLNEITSGNTEGVYRAVVQHGNSVCGYGPVMALMNYAAMSCTAYQVAVLRRGHSGEIVPSDKVFSYVSMLFTEPGENQC